MKWLGYLALCAAFIWFVFFRPLSSNSAETVKVEESPTETITDNASSTIEDINDIDENSDEYSDNAEYNDVENSEDNPSNDESFDNIPSPSNNGSIDLNSKYLIVVGSFGNKSNADRMLKRVKSDGKDGKMILIRGLHRVVAASTNDRTDARNLRDHFTHIYKEQAFILKQ